MKKKRVLLVFHNNFLNHQTGCNSYIFEIAKVLKGNGFSVDLFSITSIWNNFENFEELNQQYQLIDHLFLFSPTNNASVVPQCPLGENKRSFVISILGIPLVTKLEKSPPSYITSEHETYHFGWITPACAAYFQEVVEQNQYDFINIHYLQMAELLRHVTLPSHIKTIYSSHDANFMQEYLNNGLNGILTVLPHEIDIIKRFDEILCISYDEKFFFEKLCPKQTFRHLPHPLDRRTLPQKTIEIDVLLLAFKNPFNLEGLIWFVNHVVKYLDPNIRITVCGRIWWSIEADAPELIPKMQKLGIARIDFAENLDELYAKTRISICPLWGGTGMKIKTIDSLARGVPVVSTTWGVDGFADKNENGCLVTNDPKEFAVYVNRLINDPIYYQQIVETGTKYFDKYLSLEANRKVIDSAFSPK